MNRTTFKRLLAFAFVAGVAVYRFGWLDGNALAAALWIVMPSRPDRGKGRSQ